MSSCVAAIYISRFLYKNEYDPTRQDRSHEENLIKGFVQLSYTQSRSCIDYSEWGVAFWKLIMNIYVGLKKFCCGTYNNFCLVLMNHHIA